MSCIFCCLLPSSALLHQWGKLRRTCPNVKIQYNGPLVLLALSASLPISAVVIYLGEPPNSDRCEHNKSEVRHRVRTCLTVFLTTADLQHGFCETFSGHSAGRVQGLGCRGPGAGLNAST